MDEAADLSRRIDDLLSGAIDEQVREQRALAELMIGIRDGIEQLGEQVASLGEAVEAARDASERVQLAPAAGAPAEGIVDRFESVETAIGELSATVSALADRPDPVTLDPEEARALFGTTADAARESASVEAAALRELIENHANSLREAVLSETGTSRETLHAELIAAREALLAETTAIKEAADHQYAQLARRFGEARERTDAIEERLRALEATLEVVGKAPGEMKQGLDEFRSSVSEQNETLAARVQASTDTSTARLADASDRLTENAGIVASGLDGVAARFQTLQESLLAYLQVRDIALEEERDRVISELLDEFARAMDAKQRKAFAAGIRGAWASRRDRRDAKRFRMGEGKGLPRMPQAPPEAIKAAAQTLAKAPPKESKPPSPPERRPAAGPGPLLVEESPRPRPVEVPPPPKAKPKPKAKAPDKAPAKEPEAAKPPVKAAKAKAAPKPKPAKARKEPETPAEEPRPIGVPSPAEAVLLEAPPAPEVLETGEAALEAAPLEAPEPPAEAEIEVMLGAPEPGPADEPVPFEALISEEPGPSAEEPALAGEAVAWPEAPGEAPAEPAAAPKARKARAPRASKAKPETPEDRKAAKLERAARRRARQAAGGPPPAPPAQPEPPAEGRPL
jgi:hypothetical protein